MNNTLVELAKEITELEEYRNFLIDTMNPGNGHDASVTVIFKLSKNDQCVESKSIDLTKSFVGIKNDVITNINRSIERLKKDMTEALYPTKEKQG